MRIEVALRFVWVSKLHDHNRFIFYGFFKRLPTTSLSEEGDACLHGMYFRCTTTINFDKLRACFQDEVKHVDWIAAADFQPFHVRSYA